jgi:hypothetical protein
VAAARRARGRVVTLTLILVALWLAAGALSIVFLWRADG